MRRVHARTRQAGGLHVTDHADVLFGKVLHESRKYGGHAAPRHIAVRRQRHLVQQLAQLQLPPLDGRYCDWQQS